MTIASNKTPSGYEPKSIFKHNGHQPSSLLVDESEIIVLLNAEGMVTYVSPSVTALLGYPSEEIVGRHIRVFVHPGDFDIMQLEPAKTDSGYTRRHEYRLHCQDGLWRSFEGHKTNLLQVPDVEAIVVTFHVITQQKLTPPMQQGKPQAVEHFVQFYETDSSLLDSLSSFISTGLEVGDTCIVVATREHREGLEERLQAEGLDLAVAYAQGVYIPRDAGETLSLFMVDGLPVPERFTDTIGGIIEQAAQNQRPVRIFGEMVALLWMEGNQSAAIRLEELWNDLHHKPHHFSLFCSYPMHCFASETHGQQFTQICQQHSHVIPGESYTALVNADERLRAITLLQQKAHALEAEIAERKAAEERLQVSENRYRRLFEASQDGILIVDPLTGKIVDVNSSMRELLGLTREQVLDQELWQIGLFQDREASLKVLRDVQERHSIRYEALPLQTRDRSGRYIELVSSQYRTNGHEVIQCNVRDITKRKQIEEALLYQAAIVESSDDAILSKNLDGIVTSWNAAAERMYGYSVQEIVGQPVTLLFMPNRQGEFTQIMTRILRGERVDHYETRRVRKDGTILTVSVTVSPIKDDTGVVIGASAIARNITEQRQLEAKFRQLFDSNLIGVFVLDFAGTFLDANDALLDLLGYTRAELLAGVMQRDALTPPEFHLLNQTAMETLQETGSFGPYEKEYLHKSGRRIPVLLAATRIEQTETCLGFALDITERKELDKRKDEFISMASHELKTPVTSLKGFLNLLQRSLTKQGDTNALHYLTRMNTQVNKLTNLINDLLDLSKMHTGKIAYREELFDMDALVQEIMENVQETTQTHRLVLEGQSLAQVLGDRDRIGQVLINLLNNAIKYSPQANIVRIHVAKEQNKVCVSVQDFGIGIAQEHQQKIFERFYQVSDSEEKTYPGLGIGLYISLDIIKRHGGRVWVESQKGKGSTFHFTLPLVEEERR